MATLREIFERWTPNSSILELEDAVFQWGCEYGEQVQGQIARKVKALMDHHVKVWTGSDFADQIRAIKLRPPPISKRDHPEPLPELHGSHDSIVHTKCPNCDAHTQAQGPGRPLRVTCYKCGTSYVVGTDGEVVDYLERQRVSRRPIRKKTT